MITKRIKLFFASFAFVVLGTVALFAPAAPVGAVDVIGDACKTSGSAKDNPLCKETEDESATTLIKTLINVLLYVVGALAIVMIIWAGLSYITSTGDSGRIKRAKDVLLYSIIGLVVAILSYAIVNWILDDVFNVI